KGSTIANNTLTVGPATNVFNKGGGIHSDTTLPVTSDTITGNSASDGANLEGTAITLTNTIIAQPLGGGSNCEFFGSTSSAGHNWADDNTCDPTGTGDVDSGDPNLETLGNYGGPTQTRPPKPPTGPSDTGVIDQGVAA